MDRLAFRRLVTGAWRGPAADVARGLLWCAQPAYAAAIATRNAYYSHVIGAVQRVDLPVISVGNLTVGGTGKTPTVAYLANWLQQNGLRVAIVSRGYGAKVDGHNDEARELATLVPGVYQRQNPDRLVAAQEIASRQLADVILLDDGFQHRHLHRDLDVVLIDALQPDGLGYLLPRGWLREPLSSVRRADVLALTRADAITAPARDRLRDSFMRWSPDAQWIEFACRPTTFVNTDREQLPCSRLTGHSVAAFCGIGNPTGFQHSLQQLGLDVALFREFPDHCAYSDSELDAWEQVIASDSKVTAVVCTCKDLIKIPRRQLAQQPLWALQIEMEPLGGCDELATRLSAVLGREISY